MVLQRHHSRVCRKTHKNYTQTQRVFKTAPLYAVTNPDPAAAQSVLDAFTAFFESLWSPITGTTAAAEKSGMSYVYDEDGTLIADTLTGGAQSSWGQSARYVYLPTASGPMPVAAIYGTKHYAVQSDHLNTPRRLIQSDGQVAWQWVYSAFGDEKPTTAKTRFANADLNQSFGTTTVPAVTFNLRYPGQYFDQESNLHYNLNRSYDSARGRYTQADPIGLDGGWNMYAYVNGAPTMFTDPMGLQRIPPRVEQHNRLNDPNSQFRREFGRDAFPDPFTPFPGYDNQPRCRVECPNDGGLCRPEPKFGMSLANRPGCYEVCTSGPFLDANNSQPPVSNPPHQRPAGTGEWQRLIGILRGR